MTSVEDLKKASDKASNPQPTTTTTRATDVKGSGKRYSNPRPEGDTSGMGRPADFGVGQGHGTARKTYRARALYSEYLDDVNQRDRYLQTATRSTNVMGRPTLTFARREDELNFKSAAADVRLFENNNLDCDRGDSGACGRAGRGSAPTEYASPFVSSEHFSDVAYFGAGGRQQVDENAITALAPVLENDTIEVPVDADGTVAPLAPPAHLPQTTPGLPNDPFPDAVDGFNEDGTRPDLPPSIWFPDLPDEVPVEEDGTVAPLAPPRSTDSIPAILPPSTETGEAPIEPSLPENTGASSSVLKPKHKKRLDPFSGGGSHSGGDGSASHHGTEGIERFDSGLVPKLRKELMEINKRIRNFKQNEKNKQFLINVEALRNPYGRICSADKKEVI